MARQLSATTQLDATIPSTGGAMTLAAWIYSDTASTGGYPASTDRWISYGGNANDAFVIRREWNGSVHGDCYVNGAAGGRVNAGQVTAGVWEHWCGTADGSTIRLYKDGAEVGNTSQTQAIGAQTVVQVGRSDTEGFDGRFAEIGVWNRALSAEEVATLGRGFSPLFLPASLVDYWPLVRTLNGVKGSVFTETGSTSVGDHARVFNASRVWIARTPAAVGGSAVPRFMYDYRRRRVA